MPTKSRFLAAILFILLFVSSAFGRDLVVTFIDVGQGDSILVETPDGKNILIDGGGIPAYRKKSYRIGTRVIDPFLGKKKIKKLDKVILTHGHTDHLDGLLDIVAIYPVTEFVDTLEGGGITDDGYIKLLETVKNRNIKYRLAMAGDKLDFGPFLQVLVLNPPKKRFDNPNDNSLVLKITYNKVSFLLTADIGQVAERQILSAHQELARSTILKVGHHGSRGSSCAAFLHEVKPEMAIISCGRNNSFGHPHPEVLKRLKRANIPYLITAKKGTVSVITDGLSYHVSTEY
jgi:beta-lactamase superfamily II metal-dependent hydrolase